MDAWLRGWKGTLKIQQQQANSLRSLLVQLTNREEQLQRKMVTGEKGEIEEKSPLLVSSSHRTGTLWTAVAHIITGVIGSGVLSLAWSMAQLGWVAGPLAMAVFASVTFFSTRLLCDCYLSPDPEHGPHRNASYVDAVRLNLGEKSGWVSGIFVHISLYGMGIAYTITSTISLRAIRQSNCYHNEGHNASCDFSKGIYMLIFGIIEILMSQIPNMHNIAWISVVAAVMSFAYSFIGLGLGIAKVIENGVIKGSIGGNPASSAIDKVWLVAQGLGDIAFAYPYSYILIEIQDTLKSPPPETHTMKRASSIAIVITTFFYLLCGGFGYAAFGTSTPGNLLTGFGFYEPYWLVDFANACIVVHLIGGYQVYSQPMFAAIDRWLAQRFPNSRIANSQYTLNLPLLPSLKLNLFRITSRTVYVASTTAIAMLFPYFNQVLGVIGALNIWPLTIYFPVEMYLAQRAIRPWTWKWVVLQAYTSTCFVVVMFALCGSLEGLITEKSS